MVSIWFPISTIISPLHPLNALSPIFLTLLFFKSILENATQSLYANAPMVSICSPVTIFSSELHSINMQSGIFVNVFGNLTFFSFEHPFRTPFPKILIVSGKLNSSIFTHPSKALASICFTESGILISFSNIQFLNERLPTAVTV